MAFYSSYIISVLLLDYQKINELTQTIETKRLVSKTNRDASAILLQNRELAESEPSHFDRVA